MPYSTVRNPAEEGHLGFVSVELEARAAVGSGAGWRVPDGQLRRAIVPDEQLHGLARCLIAAVRFDPALLVPHLIAALPAVIRPAVSCIEGRHREPHGHASARDAVLGVYLPAGRSL